MTRFSRILEALFAVLVIGVTAAAAVTATGVNRSASAVEFSREDLAGDPAAADGLAVNIPLQMNGRVLWENEVRYENGEIEGRTEAMFAKEQVAYHFPAGKHYLQFFEECGGGFSLNNIEEEMEYSRAADPIRYDVMTRHMGEESYEEEVKLSDYYAYYPIRCDYYLADDLQESIWSGMDQVMGPSIPVDSLEGLETFLKIPVLADQTAVISVKQEGYYDHGEEISLSYDISAGENADSFSIHGFSAVGSDRCFFAVKNRTARGNHIDMSEIPGGYGIFSFPFYAVKDKEVFDDGLYSGTYADFHALETICPLDEREEVIGLFLSEDEEELVAALCDQESVKDAVLYSALIIDARTGEEKQRLNLGTVPAGGETDAEMIASAVDACGILLGRRDLGICLLAREESGWEVALKISCDEGGTGDGTGATIGAEAGSGNSAEGGAGNASAGDFAAEATAILLQRLDESYGLSFDWDGSRLAAGCYLMGRVYDEEMKDVYFYQEQGSCAASVLVFDADGLCYRGNLATSLGMANRMSEDFGFSDLPFGTYYSSPQGPDRYFYDTRRVEVRFH